MIYHAKSIGTNNESVEYFKDTKSTSYNVMASDKPNTETLSFPSANAFESLARTNPELFNTKRLKMLQGSKNIVRDFNAYLNFMSMRAAPDWGKIESSNDIYAFNTTLYAALRNKYNEFTLLMDMSPDEAKRVIAEAYIPESLTESGCRKLISIRLDKNKLLIDTLTKMLKSNYTMLGLSSAEAASLIEELNNEETDNKAIGQVKAILKDPKILNKFKLGENNYDFRPIGGAVIFLSSDPSIQLSQHPSKRLMDIFKYDAIVTAHGNHSPMPSIRGKSRRWVIQPVDTLTKSKLTHMDDVLRALKKEGFKNVYIGACNPKDDPIPDDIKRDLNFKVYMGRSSVYLENDITDSNEYKALLEMETELSEIDDIYGYDNMSLQELYNEIDSALNAEVVHEGVMDTLKNLASKAVQFIVSIWKRIVGFFKNIFAKGIEFVRNKFGIKIKSKTKKPVKTSVIEFKGDRVEVKEYTCNTPDDIKNVYKASNNTIIKAIQTYKSKETDHIARLEDYIKSGKVKPDKAQKSTNENTIFSNIAFI